MEESHWLENILFLNKNTMRQILLLGFFTFIASIAQGQSSQKNFKNTEKTDVSKTWKLHDESDYSVKYPNSYELDKSGQIGTKFILFSKPTSPQDMFRENVNLMIQDLTAQNVDLDMYVKISEEQIKAMLTESKMIESKRLTDHKNKQFQRLIYIGKQGQLMLKWHQYYWVENKKAYVLTLTCEANQYDKYVSEGENIMKTFTIK